LLLVVYVVEFQVSKELRDYIVHKDSFERVSLGLEFRLYQAGFNVGAYAELRKSYDKKLVDLGMSLMDGSVLDVSIPI
jgi:hypothetical protein